jgi:hypothetical protein
VLPTLPPGVLSSQLGLLWSVPIYNGPGKQLTRAAFASPGAHELEQMQLILDTIPVVREEDKEELLRVMPSFVSSTWEVKRPLRKLLPDVNSEGTRACTGASSQEAGLWL